MIKTLFVKSDINDYIEKNCDISAIIIDDFFKNNNKIKHISEKYPTYYLKAKECNKNIGTCMEIMEFFSSHFIKRNDTVLIIGGGITHDVGAFACSIYKRGVSFLYAPTTLLSCVDVCVGGKTGVNFKEYKNFIGTFYEANKIIFDISFLKSINICCIIGGICEAIKTCYANNSYNEIEETIKQIILKIDKKENNDYDESFYELISILIEKSFYAKKSIVELDKFDNDVRRLLNFGHTFGHAIESASYFKINHGIAVAIGILYALELEKFLMTMSNEIVKEIINETINKKNKEKIKEIKTQNDIQTIKTQASEIKNIIMSILRHVPSQISVFKKLKWDKLRSFLCHDKKNTNNNAINFIVPNYDMKSSKINEFSLSSSDDLLVTVFENIIGKF